MERGGGCWRGSLEGEWEGGLDELTLKGDARVSDFWGCTRRLPHRHMLERGRGHGTGATGTARPSGGDGWWGRRRATILIPGRRSKARCYVGGVPIRTGMGVGAWGRGEGAVWNGWARGGGVVRTSRLCFKILTCTFFVVLLIPSPLGSWRKPSRRDANHLMGIIGEEKNMG